MDKEMKDRIRFKCENGILLDSEEMDAILEVNPDFGERKKQETLTYFDKYGGIERFAEALEARRLKSKQVNNKLPG
jgi:hypothetical protein